VRRVALIALVGCGRVGFDAADVAFSDACRYPKLAIVRDGLAVDDAAAVPLPQAILDGCNRSATVRTVSQDDPGILDPATDRPLLPPDELGVLVGGTAPQHALHYLQLADTPLVITDTAGEVIVTSRDNRTIVDVPFSSLGPSHDITVVMYVCAAANGVCVVSVAGEQAIGTRAGAYYLTTVLAPALPPDRTWFVLDWKDGDGDLAPSAGDTFTVIGAG
jgi:hypothetical protein